MNSVIDTDKFFDASDAKAQEKKAEAEALHTELLKHISPAGALNLPPLLDKRRLEFGMPDEFFRAQCMYEFVHIYQLELIETETAGAGSLIVRPDAVRDRQRREAHRGVVISAGLGAQDIGLSNGWAVGHVIHFIQLAPFRQRAVTINGKDFDFLVMRAGDIRSSEDLMKLLRDGKVRTEVFRDPKGIAEHRYINEDGTNYCPLQPYLAEDQ